VNTGRDWPAQLHLDGAAYRYPSLRGARGRVLSDITWHAGRGVSGIIGPNGSGKSTLLTLCAQLARPTSGSVEVRTANGDALSRKEVFSQSLLAFVHNAIRSQTPSRWATPCGTWGGITSCRPPWSKIDLPTWQREWD
jgi:ABC-type dipeptide/oligopeptide/nickel transport system ATPase subunit